MRTNRRREGTVPSPPMIAAADDLFTEIERAAAAAAAHPRVRAAADELRASQFLIESEEELNYLLDECKVHSCSRVLAHCAETALARSHTRAQSHPPTHKLLLAAAASVRDTQPLLLCACARRFRFPLLLLPCVCSDCGKVRTCTRVGARARALYTCTLARARARTHTRTRTCTHQKTRGHFQLPRLLAAASVRGTQHAAASVRAATSI